MRSSASTHCSRVARIYSGNHILEHDRAWVDGKLWVYGSLTRWVVMIVGAPCGAWSAALHVPVLVCSSTGSPEARAAPHAVATSGEPLGEEAQAETFESETATGLSGTDAASDEKEL